jgi:hypothetical protein
VVFEDFTSLLVLLMGFFRILLLVCELEGFLDYRISSAVGRMKLTRLMLWEVVGWW